MRDRKERVTISMRAKLAFIIVIGCTVVANILMKLGAVAPVQDRLFGIVGWKTVLGLVSLGLGALIYAWILTLLPLNIAQSFAAAQFIAVILASSIILSEPIPIGRWLGISCIFLGILIVSASGGF